MNMPKIFVLLRQRMEGMTPVEIETFTEGFEQWCEDLEDDDDDLRADDEAADQSTPSKDRWPGNIRLRTPTFVRVSIAGGGGGSGSAGHGRLVGLGDIAKLHAIGARVGYDNQDRGMQAAYVSAIARRMAFADLAEEIRKVAAPYSREQILSMINIIDDPPWETPIQDPAGPLSAAILAGHWRCTCGWMNSDLRRKCRHCEGERT